MKTPFVNKSHGMRKYDKLCCDIFDIEQNIRFAAVYDKDFERKAGGIRKGVDSYFSKDQLRDAILQQFKGWATFMVLRKQVGEPQYSVIKYDRAILATFFLNVNELLFVSFEPIVDLDNTIRKIQSRLMNL